MSGMSERPTLGARLMKLLGFAILATALLAMAFRAPDRVPESLVARWAPPPSDFIELPLGDGLTQLVHLRDEGPRGDPRPLVLLHGNAASLHVWEGWVKALAPQRRVITLDWPGSGLTGPAVSGDYTDAADLRFLQTLLTHLRIDRAVLGGHGMGGRIAWLYAAAHPAQVAGLVLVDADGFDLPDAALPPGFTLPRWPVLGELAGMFLPRPMVDRTLRNLYGDPAKVTAAQVDRHFELILREGNREALTRRLAEPRPGDPVATLSGLTTPTLIVWGGRDRLMPPEAAQRFHQAIAGSRVEVFPALGHWPQEEDPLSTVRPVQTFLQSL